VVLTVLLLALAAGVVFVIAAVVVGREASRLDASSPVPVFDLDEAVTWIAERLPPEVTASVSYADVRRILELSLEHLPVDGRDAMVADDETVEHVASAGRREGAVWSDSEVWAVVDQEAGYLEAIGAVGFPAPEKGGGPTEDSH
jgi:hypothetical protein